MSMTKEERIAKNEILKILAKSGYPTYANILDNFDVNLTRDPGVVGYMEPGKGRIVLNRGLDLDQVSTITRHEILHQYLEHEKRLLKKLSKSKNLDYDNLDDASLNDLKYELYSNKDFNIAGDYEISNRGYTDADKEIVRNIKLNGQILTGLVTEDEHPDWVDLSIEDMYDKLTAERKKDEKQNQQNNQNKQDKKQSKQQGQEQGNSHDDSGQNSQGDNQQSQQGSQSDNNQPGDNQQDNNPQGDGQQDSNSDSEQQQNDSKDGDVNSQEKGDKKDSPSDGKKSNSPSDSSDENGRDSNNGSDMNSDSSSDSNDSADSSSDSQSGSDSGNGSKSKKPKKDPNAKPTIGDKGDEDIQKAEDEERKKTIEKEKAEDAEKGISSDDEEDDSEERLKKIKDLLNDKSTAERVTGEAEEVVNKERLAKAARDLNRYNNSPLKKFKESLQGFIKKEIGEEKNKSWSRINKKYAGTGTIKAGVSKHASGKIPLINVYFDRSGSWDSDKTKVGEQAISTLNNYVRQHKLKIDLYYFNTEIHSEDPGGRGGTRGTPILEHIKATKPDNVIVMTDDDIRDCSETVTVPGGVWLLFKGGVSDNLQEHLKGKKMTKSFNLE